MWKILTIIPCVLLLMNAAIANDHVVIETSLGTFEVELYNDDAPKTVKNFVELTKKGFYDGILVHRIARDFVIQAGDPKTKDPSQMKLWGTGGESIYGKSFEDELNSGTQSYKTGYAKGVLAMANSGPGTNSSQFFVLLEDQTSWMPHNYTIFGKVTTGMDVVEKIGSQPIVNGDNPHQGNGEVTGNTYSCIRGHGKPCPLLFPALLNSCRLPRKNLIATLRQANLLPSTSCTARRSFLFMSIPIVSLPPPSIPPRRDSTAMCCMERM
jgi:peptidyl-prolyl cis-trans isomerase-like 1